MKGFKIAVFDTEDDSQECLAREGHGFNKRITQIACVTETGLRYHNRGNVDAFLDWAKGLGKDWIFYAHNLGYDLGMLRKTLPDISVDLIGGRIIEASARDLRFRDSFNLWRSSVKTIGTAFGLEKLEMDIHNKEYVFRDCEIILRALLFARDMASEFGVDYLPKTIGGLAIKIFESRFGSIPHCSDLFVKKAYYGGRTELFQSHTEGEHVWQDVNSMYPWTMLGSFATELVEQQDIECHGIAEATIEVPKDSHFGLLPMRAVINKATSIVYPVGNWRSWFSCEELRESKCKIVKIHSVYGSKTGENYYAGFINEFYTRRLLSNSESHKMFFKLLMNNLYGRLGMSGKITKSQALTDDDFCNGELVCESPVYGNKKLVSYEIPLPETVNFLHAVTITARARIKLLQRMQDFGERMIYCDTDSVIATGGHNENSKALGEWGLKGNPKVVMTYLPKTYRIDNEFVAKGIKKKNAKTFIETGSSVEEQPFKFRESVFLWEKRNKASLAVWRKVEKTIRSNYASKKRFENGFWKPKNANEFVQMQNTD